MELSVCQCSLVDACKNRKTFCKCLRLINLLNTDFSWKYLLFTSILFVDFKLTSYELLFMSYKLLFIARVTSYFLDTSHKLLHTSYCITTILYTSYESLLIPPVRSTKVLGPANLKSYL